MDVTATPVNDAPVLADTALSIAVVEDAGLPMGAVGALVSAFTGGMSDVDNGAVKGIAVTATDDSHGTWYYSINNGGNWTAVARSTQRHRCCWPMTAARGCTWRQQPTWRAAPAPR